MSLWKVSLRSSCSYKKQACYRNPKENMGNLIMKVVEADCSYSVTALVS
jgi:hypothetical protein